MALVREEENAMAMFNVVESNCCRDNDDTEEVDGNEVGIGGETHLKLHSEFKPSTMGSLVAANESREGAEIIHGADECYRRSLMMLQELGFSKGVLPLKNLEECGWVKETGFMWMKQKEPYEHFFKGTNTRVRFEKEVTLFVEKKRMKKMTGLRSKQVLLWVPIVEMGLNEPDEAKIYFKSAVGIGRSFPVSAFDEEKEKVEGEKIDA
ncbi:hypothetical protein Cni_G07712 [Canna indica]|uniref:DUF538 domain-containing protein n=1 Tax=Canna indica TaxID=4628 RepID=A0AAQ3Q539_9LILI|nr:hypothetical protein Cni_G07712 [Canna indica]